MKKLILITFLVLLFTSVKSQNVIYVSSQPVDLGIGIRYDRQIISCFGIYTSVSYGNYKFLVDNYIRNHVKFSTGVLKYINSGQSNEFGLSIGMSYNLYGDRFITDPAFSTIALNKISFDIGIKIKVAGIFYTAMRYDFFKDESVLDFGISF